MTDYSNGLSTLLMIQKRINSISPIFCNHYPVAVVANGAFEIYDVNHETDEYAFINSEPCRMFIPDGVKAAFPLECYENKICAVISPDTFETLEGLALILHEFIHCAQFMECEMKLKQQLNIAENYRQANNFMWEITHPFPYSSPSLTLIFTQYFNALQPLNLSRIESLRQQIAETISHMDYEYLVWQEWKEGLARFYENKIRNSLGIEENHYGSELPMSRISFYESGSRFISVLEQLDPSVVKDMKKLFSKMKEIGCI